MNHEQQEAIEILKEFIRTDKYKNTVREKIESENKKFKAIESSMRPSATQFRQAYNL